MRTGSKKSLSKISSQAQVLFNIGQQKGAFYVKTHIRIFYTYRRIGGKEETILYAIQFALFLSFRDI
jgi:hypothetical protein